MRLALDVRVRQGKYSSFVRVTELLEEAAAAVHLPLVLWNGGTLDADVLWNPRMDPAAVAQPQVLTVHDVSPLLADPRPKWQRWRRARRFRKRLQVAVHEASALAAVSQNVQDLLGEKLQQRLPPTRVVPHFPASSFYPAAPEEQEQVLSNLSLQPGFVLFVAALRKHKNWQGAFRAWLQLPLSLQEKHPFVFAGASGRGARELKKLLQQVPATSRVLVLDAVNDQTLRVLYSACAAMVFPSFNEGFGLPPLEAMACGASVIASRLTAMPEVLADAASYVDPWSLGSIRQALQGLLADSEQQQHRRKASLARAKEFHPQRTGKAMLELLACLEKA